MTDELIDLDYLRSRHGVGQGTIHQLCDEIERLRTELAEAKATQDEWAQVGSSLVDIGVKEQARADALQSRLDAALALVADLEARDRRVVGESVRMNWLRRLRAALTEEAS